MTRAVQTKIQAVSLAEKAGITPRPPKFYSSLQRRQSLASLQIRQQNMKAAVATVSIERTVPWWQLSLLALLAALIWGGQNLPLPSFNIEPPAIHLRPIHSAVNYVPVTPAPEQPAAQPIQQAVYNAPPVQQAVQLPSWTPPAQPATEIEKSYREAIDSGLMRSVLYVCHVKHTRCEMLLAIAKLESNMGRYTVNDDSSARGTMQIIRPEFLRMIEAYGPRNESNLIGYLAFLPPDSLEAKNLAHDIDTLQYALNYMKGPAYRRNHELPRKMQTELLRLNNRPIVQLLFVADRLADDNIFLATHRGLTPAECERYAYLAYVHGATAADFALAAYMDPAIRNRPVAPLLTQLYAHLYAGSPGARDWAKDTTHEILVNNGQSMKTTVGQFVDTRVGPFMQLSNGYRELLDRETARNSTNL